MSPDEALDCQVMKSNIDHLTNKGDRRLFLLLIRRFARPTNRTVEKARKRLSQLRHQVGDRPERIVLVIKLASNAAIERLHARPVFLAESLVGAHAESGKPWPLEFSDG